MHGFIYLFTENPLPTSSLFCLLSPAHLCCMLTFPLPFKSVITNMCHGFDNIICFNDCILDLIPLALAYTIQGFPYWVIEVTPPPHPPSPNANHPYQITSFTL